MVSKSFHKISLITSHIYGWLILKAPEMIINNPYHKIISIEFSFLFATTCHSSLSISNYYLSAEINLMG